MNPNRQPVVYALTCPRSGIVRYVGRSSEGLNRARSHYRSRRELQKNDAKGEWIRSLLAAGLRPGVVVLEEVEPGPILDIRLAAAETRWLRSMLDMGLPLLNTEKVGSLGGNGRKLTDSHREAISRGHTGLRRTDPLHDISKCQPVLCADEGLVFLSIQSAAAWAGVHFVTMARATKLGKEIGGRTFERVDVVGRDFEAERRNREMRVGRSRFGRGTANNNQRKRRAR